VIIEDVAPQFAPVPPQGPRLDMGRCMVTNRQFATFLADPASAGWCRDGKDALANAERAYLDHWPDGRPAPDMLEDPVVNVSAKAAVAYLQWSSTRIRRPLRLPTADEWRLAAHAGRPEAEWLDDEIKKHRVNYRGTFARLSAVAEFGTNPYGICDLVGNAYDLCFDPSAAAAGGGILSACGGASWSPRSELEEPLRVDWYTCRRDIGFRCVSSRAMEVWEATADTGRDGDDA